MKRAGIFLFLIFTFAMTGDVYTPPKGSLERAAIMNALRAEVQRTQNIEVLFIVRILKLKDEWAWTVTMPVSKDGANCYEDLIALLHKEKDRWQVKEIVCTEVEMPGYADDPDFFEGLAQRFPDAPKEILTFEEKH
ncbi:MAG: hypothetical protein PHS85_03665 [Sulfurovum sp.]|nr:hypothetical protein [Sulfurovum sp.]